MSARTWRLRWVCPLWLAMVSACGGGGGGDSDTAGVLQLVETSFDVTEGAVVNIRVIRSGGSSGAASVDFVTVNGTAVGGTDYAAASGTLTWPNGVFGNRTISIPITDDSIAEFTESFTVVLSHVSGATLGANSSATVNILDNDVAAVAAVGAITALGSATVNGIRYDTSAAGVAVNGQPTQLGDLALGQVVAITGDVNLSAATGVAAGIDYSATVIGPVESVDATLKHLIVMGQTVLAHADTVYDSSIDPDTFAGLAVGGMLEVSGFRNAAGEIVARRIAAGVTSAGVQLTGNASGVDVDNRLFSVDRLTVDYGNAVLIGPPGGVPVDGQLVTIRGSLVDGILVASEIAGIKNVTAKPGERALVTGFVTRFVSPSNFDLNGFPVTTDADTRFVQGVAGDLADNAEITVDGEVVSGGDTVRARTVNFARVASDRTILTFGFDSFSNIAVNGFFNLTVTQGADYSVEVTVDSDLVGKVQVTQSGDTVRFVQVPGNNNMQFRSVFVTMPVLSRIDVEAASLANVVLWNFDQMQMVVNVDGVSVLRGRALRVGDMTATVSGVSVLDFGDIQPLGNANIRVSGVSRAMLNMDTGTTITGSVETGTGAGHSTLFYFGTNAVANVTTDGMSKVIRLGETKR